MIKNIQARLALVILGIFIAIIGLVAPKFCYKWMKDFSSKAEIC